MTNSEGGRFEPEEQKQNPEASQDDLNLETSGNIRRAAKKIKETYKDLPPESIAKPAEESKADTLSKTPVRSEPKQKNWADLSLEEKQQRYNKMKRDEESVLSGEKLKADKAGDTSSQASASSETSTGKVENLEKYKLSIEYFEYKLETAQGMLEQTREELKAEKAKSAEERDEKKIDALKDEITYRAKPAIKKYVKIISSLKAGETKPAAKEAKIKLQRVETDLRRIEKENPSKSSEDLILENIDYQSTAHERDALSEALEELGEKVEKKPETEKAPEAKKEPENPKAGEKELSQEEKEKLAKKTREEAIEYFKKNPVVLERDEVERVYKEAENQYMEEILKKLPKKMRAKYPDQESVENARKEMIENLIANQVITEEEKKFFCSPADFYGLLKRGCDAGGIRLANWYEVIDQLPDAFMHPVIFYEKFMGKNSSEMIIVPEGTEKIMCLSDLQDSIKFSGDTFSKQVDGIQFLKEAKLKTEKEEAEIQRMVAEALLKAEQKAGASEKKPGEEKPAEKPEIPKAQPKRTEAKTPEKEKKELTTEERLKLLSELRSEWDETNVRHRKIKEISDAWKNGKFKGTTKNGKVVEGDEAKAEMNKLFSKLQEKNKVSSTRIAKIASKLAGKNLIKESAKDAGYTLGDAEKIIDIAGQDIFRNQLTEKVKKIYEEQISNIEKATGKKVKVKKPKSAKVKESPTIKEANPTAPEIVEKDFKSTKESADKLPGLKEGLKEYKKYSLRELPDEILQAIEQNNFFEKLGNSVSVYEYFDDILWQAQIDFIRTESSDKFFEAKSKKLYAIEKIMRELDAIKKQP